MPEFVDEDRATREHVDALRKRIMDAIGAYNRLHSPIPSGEIFSALVEALFRAWSAVANQADFPRFLHEQAVDIERQLVEQGFQVKT